MAAYPRVTIMIPTYGQAPYILEAIDSALAQDYPELEVVVSDDASPDDTAARVALRRDPRLRYVRHPVNMGRVQNYRHALQRLATGDWVLNLDGDDVLTDQTFIRSAIELALRDPELVIVGARQEGQLCLSEHRGEDERGVLTLDASSLIARLHDPWFAFSHLATLYRRDTALACDTYRMDVLSSDWESLYRIALRGRVAFLHKAVGHWRVTTSNASRSTLWTQRFDNLAIWPSILREALACGSIDQAALVRLLSRLYRRSARIDLDDLLRAGKRMDAWCYWRALRQLHPATAWIVAASPKRWARVVLQPN